MITIPWVLGAIVAASAASASADELQFFSRLLKRQEPGTPEYYCHDNCGQAIIAARNSGDDVCTNEVFLTDYQNCLQCSGPDNVDVWKYYGGTLSKAAEPCGLATTPLAGEQPDVGPAIPADGGSSSSSPSSSSSEEEQTTTVATVSSSEPTTTTTATTTADGGDDEATGSTTAAPTPTGGGSSQEPSSTATATATTASSGYATSAGGPSVTPAPSTTQGGNGTTPSATSSGVTQVTNGANVLRSGSSAGFYGALALGAWLAAAHY